jgi:geranylgeranyl reductase family protein
MGIVSTRSWDVIVVGGGPAGAATALLLARAGASVLLLDRARFPRHKACSEYLSPATTPILERLGAGVLPAIERAAHAKLYGMTVVAPSGAAMSGHFASDRSDRGHAPPRPYSFAVSRAILDTILLRAAAQAGAVIREGAAVEDLVWDRGRVAGVVARSRNAQRATCTARVVVGADGLHSVVARRLGLLRTSPPRRIAFTAHVAHVAGVEGMGELHVGDRGYVGLGPIGEDVTTVALVVPRAAARGRTRDFRRGFFAELERYPRLAGRFEPRRLVRDVLATGPFAQWARRPAVDGALLVGDAADFFDPFTGQGIYAALRGAELAADCLIPGLTPGASSPIPASMLEPYVRARRREFAGKWALERLIGLGVGWPALTERVVGRLARRPDLADLLVGATGNFVPARRVLAAGFLARLLW